MTFKIKNGLQVGGTQVLDSNGNLLTSLSTPRNITISGSVSGSATFDGSQDITITTTGGASVDVVRTPTITSPSNSSTNVARWPTVTTNAYGSVYGIAHSATQIQISTVSNFSSVTVDSGSLGAVVSWNCPTQLAENATYYVRARHKDADNVWSSWSGVISFTTINSTINTPSISSPSNGATGIGQTPVISASAYSCNDTQITHLNSDWQISTVNTFASILAQSLADSTNKTSWQVPAATLSANTTYYTRVRYRGSDNTELSSWSSTVSFTTMTSFGTTTMTTSSNYGSWYDGGAAVDPATGMAIGFTSSSYVARASFDSMNLIDYRDKGTSFTKPYFGSPVRLSGGKWAFSNWHNDYSGDKSFYVGLFPSDLSTGTLINLPDNDYTNTCDVLAAGNELYTYRYNKVRRFDANANLLNSIQFDISKVRNIYNMHWDGTYLWGIADYQSGNWQTSLFRTGADFSSPVGQSLGYGDNWSNMRIGGVLDNGNLLITMGNNNNLTINFATVSRSTLAYSTYYQMSHTPGHTMSIPPRGFMKLGSDIYCIVNTYNSSSTYYSTYLVKFNTTMTGISIMRKISSSTGTTYFYAINSYNGNIVLSGQVNNQITILKTNTSLGNVTGTLPSHTSVSFVNTGELTFSSITTPTASALTSITQTLTGSPSSSSASLSTPTTYTINTTSGI